MNAPTRRQKIEAMLVDDPSDPFLLYSLAMELDKEQEHETSLAHYRQLMAATPPYVPAFFMAAQQLARLERVEEARAVLREGIEQARAAREQPRRRRDERVLGELGCAGLAVRGQREFKGCVRDAPYGWPNPLAQSSRVRLTKARGPCRRQAAWRCLLEP